MLRDALRGLWDAVGCCGMLWDAVGCSERLWDAQKWNISEWIWSYLI